MDLLDAPLPQAHVLRAAPYDFGEMVRRYGLVREVRPLGDGPLKQIWEPSSFSFLFLRVLVVMKRRVPLPHTHLS